MVIHDLFTEEEQAIINKALNNYSDHCTKQICHPRRGYGSASEAEKKKKWRYLKEDIEALQSKIVELTF